MVNNFVRNRFYMKVVNFFFFVWQCKSLKLSSESNGSFSVHDTQKLTFIFLHTPSLNNLHIYSYEHVYSPLSLNFLNSFSLCFILLFSLCQLNHSRDIMAQKTKIGINGILIMSFSFFFLNSFWICVSKTFSTCW